jgi:hypothetical protein
MSDASWRTGTAGFVHAEATRSFRLHATVSVAGGEFPTRHSLAGPVSLIANAGITRVYYGESSIGTKVSRSFGKPESSWSIREKVESKAKVNVWVAQSRRCSRTLDLTLDIRPLLQGFEAVLQM